MTYTVEIIVRGTHDVDATELSHDGNEPEEWTERDVAHVLKAIVQEIGRLKMDEPTGTVALRGLSWVVTPYSGGVVIGLDIASGQAVAGPFDIDQARLEGLITQALAVDGASGAVH